MNRTPFHYRVAFTNGDTVEIACYWSPRHPSTLGYVAEAAAAMHNAHTNGVRVEPAAPATLIS